jgi:hypothetical protein
MKPSASIQPQLVDTEPTALDSGAAAADALGPVRLSAGGGDEFEQSLVEASAFDRIPAASRERLARALGVPRAVAPPTALEQVVRGSPWIKYGAFLGLGAFGLLAATATSRWVAPAPAEPTPALVEAAALVPAGNALVPATPELETPGAPPTPAPPDALATSGSVLPRVRPAPSRAPRRAVSHAAATPRSPAAPSDRKSLRDELSALEASQAALLAGRIEAAEEALADYARRFPHGELALEAELLDVDVLIARGQQDRALRRARALLDRPEAARYRERLEALWPEEIDSVPASGANQRPSHMNGQR